MKDLQCLRKGIIFHGKVGSEGFWIIILKRGIECGVQLRKGAYKRPMIANPYNTTKRIFEPLSKMTEGNKKQYIANVKVMNYLLQAIPNDIYNSVDACKNAKDMWERIKQLMFGSDVTSHVRHSRLMDEFDKFAAKERESSWMKFGTIYSKEGESFLESVYEILTTLVACSFMLCDLDFEPLSLSLSSLPSCDLVSLTNMLILLHYLESFKSEFAEVFVFKS
ncbi:hypothetical protein Tco_0266140 [Tanacetum coccineum]